jgi:predicted SpoU family rRNA methylase
MQALIVGYIDATPVYLQDIARVYKTNKEREIVTKIDGSEAVEIEIYKAAEANMSKSHPLSGNGCLARQSSPLIMGAERLALLRMFHPG